MMVDEGVKHPAHHADAPWLAAPVVTTATYQIDLWRCRRDDVSPAYNFGKISVVETLNALSLDGYGLVLNDTMVSL